MDNETKLFAFMREKRNLDDLEKLYRFIAARKEVDFIELLIKAVDIRKDEVERILSPNSGGEIYYDLPEMKKKISHLEIIINSLEELKNKLE